MSKAMCAKIVKNSENIKMYKFDSIPNNLIEIRIESLDQSINVNLDNDDLLEVIIHSETSLSDNVLRYSFKELMKSKHAKTFVEILLEEPLKSREINELFVTILTDKTPINKDKVDMRDYHFNISYQP